MLRVSQTVSSWVAWAHSLGTRGTVAGQKAKMASFIRLASAADGRGLRGLLYAGCCHVDSSLVLREKADAVRPESAHSRTLIPLLHTQGLSQESNGSASALSGWYSTGTLHSLVQCQYRVGGWPTPTPAHSLIKGTVSVLLFSVPHRVSEIQNNRRSSWVNHQAGDP